MKLKKEKLNRCIKNLLKEKYNLSKEDFISSDFEIVSSLKLRYFGIDKTMVAGYGQDDKCCVYVALRAILDSNDNNNISNCAVFTDKEETSSSGATGAKSLFFENIVLQLLNITGYASLLDLRITLSKSILLSCDVSSAMDSLFGNVSDKNNCAKFN